MKFSADPTGGKCSPRLKPCGQKTVRNGAILLLTFLAGATSAWSAVPLPKPRPAQAPGGSHVVPQAAEPEDDANGAGDGRDGVTPAAPSACRAALTDVIAIAPSVPPIRGPGACGGEDLVRLEAVVLSDGRHVAVKPAAVLRCTMASAVADWVRTDAAALAEGLGTTLSEIDNFDSFECRGRNRIVGAKLSEHGLANALDVRGLKLANGKFISLTDRAQPRELREQVRHSVCARFSTVLGPGSDWYHEEHIHLDLADRRGNYKTCQWNVYDPLPVIAPLLPAARPVGAPPREEIAGEQQDDTALQPAPAQPEAVEPETPDAPQPPPKKPRKNSKSPPLRLKML